MTTPLRDRCKAVLSKIQMDGMLRQNDPVQTLVEFVIAERGKAAAPEIDGASPLCLYFPDDAERDAFVALVHEAKPGMVMRKVP